MHAGGGGGGEVMKIKGEDEEGVYLQIFLIPEESGEELQYMAALTDLTEWFPNLSVDQKLRAIKWLLETNGERTN